MFNPMYLYKVSHFFYNHKLQKLANIVSRVNYFFTNADIPGAAVIGKNVVFAHHGSGVVLNSATIIKDNVIIYHNTTIGRQRGFIDKVDCSNVSITINSGTLIGAGTIILAKNHLVIGENVDIGAGSIIVKNVPDNSVVLPLQSVIKNKKL